MQNKPYFIYTQTSQSEMGNEMNFYRELVVLLRVEGGLQTPQSILCHCVYKEHQSNQLCCLLSEVI